MLINIELLPFKLRQHRRGKALGMFFSDHLSIRRIRAGSNKVAIGKVCALAQQIDERQLNLLMVSSPASEMRRELRDEQRRLGTSERCNRMPLGKKPEGKHRSADDDGYNQRADGENSHQRPANILAHPFLSPGLRFIPCVRQTSRIPEWK